MSLSPALLMIKRKATSAIGVSISAESFERNAKSSRIRLSNVGSRTGSLIVAMVTQHT
jgi:hypothetical protein